MRRRSASTDKDVQDQGKTPAAPLDPIDEGSPEKFSSPPAHRTRNALKQISTVIENSTTTKEIKQNIQNTIYEFESSGQTITNGRPQTPKASQLSYSDSVRLNQSSPSGSDASNVSFAESVLADSSRVSVDGVDHLPYRLYKLAGEYWNKYPKTDYTYSRFSKDRVELAPGQIAVPNMSRVALGNHRLDSQYSSTSSFNEDWTSKYEASPAYKLRSRSNYRTYSQNLSDSETEETDSRTYKSSESERWWITRLVITIWTTITTMVTTVVSKIFRRNPSDRYGVGGNYYNTYTTRHITRTTTTNTIIEESKWKKWWWLPLLLLLLLLAPIGYWLLAGQTSERVIVTDNSNIALTEDMIREIVKNSIHIPESPSPQDIERLIEEKNVLYLSLLDKQKELIDRQQSEIEDLKERLNKFSDRSADEHEALILNLKNAGESVKSEILMLKESLMASAAANTAVVTTDSACSCDESMMMNLIKKSIDVYDADKTGKADYALESVGGQVISIKCTKEFEVRSTVLTIYGIPFWYPKISPRVVIQYGIIPGNCWSFQGFPGYLVIKLAVRIVVSGFTVEHIPQSISFNNTMSAPHNFTVMGLQNESDTNPTVFGNYQYRNDSTAVQYFAVDPSLSMVNEPVGFEYVELKIDSNHGHPQYTCLYRFRVHGEPVVV